jgi:hypothetical protein
LNSDQHGLNELPIRCVNVSSRRVGFTFLRIDHRDSESTSSRLIDA